MHTGIMELKRIIIFFQFMTLTQKVDV